MRKNPWCLAMSGDFSSSLIRHESFRPMSTRFAVRNPTLADAAVIADFNCRLARESEGRELSPDIIAAGVLAVLNGHAESEYFLAEVDGRIVGQMMLTREWSDWRNGWFYWIQSVYVAADCRRQGIFTRLYHEAMTRVGARSETVGIRLYVEAHNERARKTYEKLGLLQTGYEVLELPLRRTLPTIVAPTPTQFD